MDYVQIGGLKVSRFILGSNPFSGFAHQDGELSQTMIRYYTTERIPDLVAMIRDKGMPAGAAGHDPRVIEWAAEHLDLDFHMCAYYNPAPRNERGEVIPGEEVFLAEDRERMVGVIKQLPKPVIHYKIMAAGRNDPQEAFTFAAQHMRPGDAVCVGVFPKDKPDMIAEDVALLNKASAAGPGS